MPDAVVVFTKVPKVGETKTRLTEARGGMLTPEEANLFYQACLLDVCEACLEACRSRGADFWICHDAAGDGAHLELLLSELPHQERFRGLFADQGGSFDNCMQFAADYLLRPGSETRLADSVVIIGGDVPTLQPQTVETALRLLESLSRSQAGQAAARGPGAPGAALVEAPCQEGGFSLVGLTCSTPFDFQGVFYNREGITALDMLVTKAERARIPLGVLEMVPDVDIPVDLASAIPVLRSLELAARSDSRIFVPRRTLAALRDIGVEATALPAER